MKSWIAALPVVFLPLSAMADGADKPTQDLQSAGNALQQGFAVIYNDAKASAEQGSAELAHADAVATKLVPDYLKAVQAVVGDAQQKTVAANAQATAKDKELATAKQQAIDKDKMIADLRSQVWNLQRQLSNHSVSSVSGPSGAISSPHGPMSYQHH